MIQLGQITANFQMYCYFFFTDIQKLTNDVEQLKTDPTIVPGITLKSDTTPKKLLISLQTCSDFFCELFIQAC